MVDVMTRDAKWRWLLLMPLMAALLFGVVRWVQAAEPELFIVKGDLHCHSNFSSDSAIPPEQVIKESALAGYDFIALTEHNTLRHLATDLSTPDLLVISGYEHTVTPVAHLNVFGLRSFDKKTAIYSKEEMAEYLAYLRKEGALLQLNHPNDKTYYSRFGYDYDIDFLEIANGSWGESDLKTLQDYQTLLCQGRKLIATGGTDAHLNHKVRKVFNCVLVAEKTEKAILEGLKAGRNYVTVKADGPVISLKCGDTLMGGTVAYQEGQAVNITINNMTPGTMIKLYTSNGLVITDTYTVVDQSPYVKEVSTKGIKFCRVELWFDQENICAYSNPIYIK